MTTNLPCLAEQPQQKPDHPRNDQSEQEASVYAGEVRASHSTTASSLLGAVTTGDLTTEYAA